MCDDPPRSPKSIGGKVDMSWEAIWQRLRRVDELNELCRYLGEFEPVSDRDAPAALADGSPPE